MQLTETVKPALTTRCHYCAVVHVKTIGLGVKDCCVHYGLAVEKPCCNGLSWVNKLLTSYSSMYAGHQSH